MPTERAERQLRFILEIDALKRVLRQTLITDGSRRENSAEHSWHLALMAPLLAEYAVAPVDLLRVTKMLLVHDVVEIDAGDAFAYDAGANEGKADRERQAARRIFGLLPHEQADELCALWEEFEAAATPEARYANALDRLQPLLHNSRTQGGTWRIHAVRRAQVLRRMQPIREATPALWPLVERVLDEAEAAGHLLP